MAEKQGQPWIESRRSQRIVVRLPVLIYGSHDDGTPFQEESFTVSVNAHGALLMMASPARIRQKLLLTNPATEEEAQCEVAFLGAKRGGKMEVGVEFTEPATKFWRMNFPPVDWKPAPRKKH